MVKIRETISLIAVAAREIQKEYHEKGDYFRTKKISIFGIVKLFSKSRMGSLKIKKLRNYALYAIGEIVLVVIGILIAVSINNYNEQKKEEARLQTFLKDYRNDLVIDTTAIGQQLKILDLKKDAFNLVLSDTFNLEHLNKTPMVYALILTYSPIKLQSKGYTELKNYAANHETETDTLLQRIVAEHAAYTDLVDEMTERVSNDVDDNMTYFKNNEAWVGDLLNNNVTEEVRNYFMSRDFRNRAAIHHTLVYNNVYAILKTYRDKYVLKTLRSIDTRLRNTTGDSQETETSEAKDELTTNQ